MVQIKAFSYNPNAKYQPSGVYKTKDPDIIKQTIEVKQPSDSGSSFKANVPDVFDKKMLPYVESDALVRAWNHTPMRFWQNQLNFAVWCATTGCGVSYEDHLSGDIPGFAKSMFMFHVYYQIRRIIFELKAPLPTDESWNAFDNSMDAKAYEKICDEFNVDKNTDWRQKLDDNGGLGIILNYITSTGYQPLKGFSYDAHQMSFTEYNKGKLHIDYISHQNRNAWSTFILDKSNGFTRPGVGRINQSIRTYCWAILGSPSQIKSDILGVGSAFDAQKQFLANTEDAIQSPVDLPSQITRYQNALTYARTKVDYVFGFGLYMAPSNMELRIGTIQGYNNKIILSTHDQKLWWNATVNLSADATSYSGNVSGTTTKKSTTEVPTVLSKPQKTNIITAVQGKTEIGAWGMPITIPTQKQADEIYKKRKEQYHKIKDTYGPTITPDPHQMSLIPKTVSAPSSKSGTHKKIKHDPATHKSADQQDTISGTHKSADQPTLGVQSTENHENNKTALILGSIIVGSVLHQCLYPCLHHQMWDFQIRNLQPLFIY